MIARDAIADYNADGTHYAGQRRPDPAIRAEVDKALSNARSVLNVGAGTGSYEPADRYVLAVEPSATMRAGRPPGLAPALAGTADNLPSTTTPSRQAWRC